MPYAAAITGALGIGQTLLNNAASQENFNEQMRFQRYQYEDMKKYNSMEQQVKRMRAAGINPALAISSGQLGTAASGVSAPSAPTFQQADLSPMVSAIGALASKKRDEAEASKLEEESTGEHIRNKFRTTREYLATLNDLKQYQKLGIDTSRAEYALKKDMFLFGKLEKDWTADYNLKKATQYKEQTQANYYDSLTLLNNEYLNWVPQEKRAQIAKDLAQRLWFIKTGNASEKQASAAMREALKQNGVFFEDARDEDNYINAVISAKDAESYGAETESRSDDWHLGSKLLGAGSGKKYSDTKYKRVGNNQGASKTHKAKRGTRKY